MSEGSDSKSRRLPLTEGSELLYRQVNKSWVVEGRLTSQAFLPFPKDKDELSVARASMTTARDAYLFFTEKLGFKSIGTWAVSVGECLDIELPAVWDPLEDPIPYESHSIIDYASQGLSSKKKEAKAKQLTAKARERGCQYDPADAKEREAAPVLALDDAGE